MTLRRWKEGWRVLAGSAFSLTPDERRIVLLILALALLGLGAKLWRRHPPAAVAEPAQEAADRPL